ncbi:MAG: hypothetical protein IH903_01065, partial [Proteobacteria bacterium]|nr:hypothetical protein [Pseudomonadota bacterium]
MVKADTALATDRHPWLDTFVADPASELDNLLSGHARIEPYESADAPDAARLLFGGLPEGDEALAALDRAVREWLDSQRAAGVPGLDQLPLERWLRKVSEAFEIVALLKLRHSALDLRQRLVVWNSWCDRLAISAQRDGRYALLRTLALTQRIVAVADPAVNPFALEPFWLHVCKHAGGALPKHFLGIGLLGLRMLPEREGAPSERPWMAGLVYWAIGQKPTAEEFSQQWWALKGLYPRMPSYWRSALTETLQQSSAKQIPDEIKDWWLQDVEAKDLPIAQEAESQSVGVPILSPLSAVQSLRQRAHKPLPSIRGEIETLVGELRHYAEVTGESYYLVTTACNIGMAVIKGADDPVGRGRFAVDLARQALAWQPLMSMLGLCGATRLPSKARSRRLNWSAGSQSAASPKTNSGATSWHCCSPTCPVARLKPNTSCARPWSASLMMSLHAPSVRNSCLPSIVRMRHPTLLMAFFLVNWRMKSLSMFAL